MSHCKHHSHAGRFFLHPCLVCELVQTKADDDTVRERNEALRERNEARRALTVAENELRGLKWEVERLQGHWNAARADADRFRGLLVRLRHESERLEPELAAEIDLAMRGVFIDAPKERLKVPKDGLKTPEEPLRAEPEQSSVYWAPYAQGTGVEARVSGYYLTVVQGGAGWLWRTVPERFYEWRGVAGTLEEAKAAALDAVGKQP